MASEANTGQHIPELFEALYTEISRMGLPVAIAFEVAGEEALTATLDVDAGEGAPPQGFALVADGKAGPTPELLKSAFFDPASISVGEGATSLSDEAALIVVDPSPTPSRGPAYDGVGAVVLSDARFAAREIANRAVEAGRELGFVLRTEASAEAATDTAETGAPAPQSAGSDTSGVRTEANESPESSRGDLDRFLEQAETADAGSTDATSTEATSTDATSTEAETTHVEDHDEQSARANSGRPDNQSDSTTGKRSGPVVGQPDYGAGGRDGAQEDRKERERRAAGGEHTSPEQSTQDAYHEPLAQTAETNDPEPEVTESLTGTGAASPEAEPPEAELPEAEQPETQPPEAKLTDEYLPDVELPDTELPDTELPEPPREGESGPATDAPEDLPAGSDLGRLDSGRSVLADEAPPYGTSRTPAGSEAPGPAAEYESPAQASEAAPRLNDLYDEEVFGPLSDYVQRLHHVREALAADAEDGRTLTPEKEKALAALESMGRGRSFYRSLRAKFKRPPDELDRIVADVAEPEWSPITVSDAEGFIRNPYPGVLLFGNNKGGVGKTMTAVEEATAIATIGVPKYHERGIKVLLVEQNFANPDLRKRVKLPPGRPPGMIEYVEAMRAAEAAGGELPDLSGYVSHVQGLETDNLYVLPIAADEGEWRHNGKVTTYDLDGVYEAAADAGFDVIVVDFQNGLPQAGDLNAETIGFWVSVADVMYLVVGRSEAVENGSTFMDGARALVEYYGHSCSLVPVFNEWHPGRSTNKRWGRGVAALGADTAIAPAQFIPSEFADEYEDADSYGGGAYFHRIPSHPAAADFCLEKRQLSLESRMFKEPFYLLALDALTRIKRNRSAYFEPASGGASGGASADSSSVASSGKDAANDAAQAGDGSGQSESQVRSDGAEEV